MADALRPETAKPRDTGGCAFPGNTGADGMSLRDYFAIRALDRIVNSEGAWKYEEGSDNRLAQCRLAYRYADAMLKARTE